jgi:hypothetical protein
MANWPGAISPTGGCVEMFVDVTCPKPCEFGDVHDILLNRPFRKIDDHRWRKNDGLTTVVDGGEKADEDALEQGYGIP